MTALFSEVLFLFPHTFRVSSNVRQDRYRSSIQPDNLLFWVNRRLTSSRSSSPGEDVLDGPGHTSRGGHRWKGLLLSWTCPPQTLLPWTCLSRTLFPWTAFPQAAVASLSPNTCLVASFLLVVVLTTCHRWSSIRGNCSSLRISSPRRALPASAPAAARCQSLSPLR